ncbi:hypothetical protein MCOR02_007561 [Pyricularia oryzae]|nr:hypothetical protein MCOR02_007561 [Pyricularia oryzae]KAI6627384.1 hypothetical protein MCOR14_008731 [Pyricularia oryzae]QBZ64339.1 hypothetical protein PoMZ_06035 [Pyricularia oryzae]
MQQKCYKWRFLLLRYSFCPIILSEFILLTKFFNLTCKIPQKAKMAVFHMVLLAFKESATPEEIDAVCKGMMALKDRCIHPSTNQPYFKSVTGGINQSKAGLDGGVQYAFVAEFENEEDLAYYNEKDPAHDDLRAHSAAIAKIQIFEYTSGVFC